MIVKRQKIYSRRATKLANKAIRTAHGYIKPSSKSGEDFLQALEKSISGRSPEALMNRINLKENNLISKGDIKILKKRGSSKEFLRALQRNHDHNLGGTWMDKNYIERKLIMKRRNNI